MTELDRIRTVEFSRITASTDEVYGLTDKGSKHFIIISEMVKASRISCQYGVITNLLKSTRRRF